MLENYVCYKESTGDIVQVGKIDRSVSPDGSTVLEYIQRYLVRYPNQSVIYTGNRTSISGDTHKVDIPTGTLRLKEISEELSTYKTQKKLEQKRLAKTYYMGNSFNASNMQIFRDSIANYYTTVVKPGIDGAVDKEAIDNFILTVIWPSS